MQAIILLCHFHSLCTFVYGCGISADQDLPATMSPPPSPGANGTAQSDPESPKVLSNNVETHDSRSVKLVSLMEKMRQLTSVPANDTSPEELLKRFHSVEHQNAESKCQ